MTVPTSRVHRLIGGFFELHEPEGAPPEESILGRWTARRRFVAFVNARSALAALIEMVEPPHVWLPTYICADVVAGSWSHRARFYPIDEICNPDIQTLERDTIPGDFVVAVDYFGRPPGREFCAFAQRRRDLQFIDDRAQALDPRVQPWADWCLYSPRKLIGVADGGILVAERPDRALPKPSLPGDVVHLWSPSLLRYEDVSETDNETWFASYRAKEAAMPTGGQEMTRLTSWILSRSSLEGLAECRVRNWRLLDKYLQRWRAFDCGADAVPFGYVITVSPSARSEILKALHSDGIFAAIHWPHLAAQDIAESLLEGFHRRIVTLPCDHRYDESVMRHLAEKVTDLLS